MGWIRLKAINFLMVAFVLLVSIAGVSAVASLDAPAIVTLGNDNSRPGTTVSTTFTITNNGNETLTNLNGSTTADSKFNLHVTNVPSSLAPNASATITLSGTVPNGQTGRSTIGNVRINSAQITKTIQVDMQARNPLSIKKIRFDIEGKGDSVQDGDRVDISAKPGETVEIRVTFENLFDKDTDDIDIDNVDVNIRIRDIDDGDDIDEDFDFDLRAEDEEEVKVTFTIPLETDEDSYDVEIDAEGDGDDGNIYRASATVSFDVEKETHDIQISRFVVTPATVDCSPRSIAMSVELTNYGRNDEDHVSFGIRQPVLGIEVNQFDIELTNDLSDSDSKYRRDIRYTIPESVRPGTYQVELTAFNDNNFAAFQIADVVVSACKQENETQPPVVQPPVVSPPTSGTGGIVIAEPPSQPQQGIPNMTLIIALAAINIVLLVAIIAVATRLMSR